MAAPQSQADICVFVSDIPKPDGRVFTAEALREMAEEDPKFTIKERPDGRVELWARVNVVASPLSSVDDGSDPAG